MTSDSGDGRRGVYGKLLLLDEVLSKLDDGCGYACEEWSAWLGLESEAEEGCE
jgi:hypothetical protein